MSSSNADFVTFGRLTLPKAAVWLACDLELRGLHLTSDGDVLNVGPSDRLTDTDRAGIRRWKMHLLAIVAQDVDAYEGWLQ